MFERTDVPEPSPLRSVVGAVIAVAAVAAAIAVTFFAWNRANLESHLGDGELAGALSDLSQYGVASPPAGRSNTGDTVLCSLLLTASGLDSPGATLEGAHILAINSTKGTATLVSLPVDLALTVDGDPTTLSELFSAQGHAACVVPLGRAAGLRLSSGVIVSTGDVLEEAARLAGSDAGELLDSAADLVSRIRTNLSPAGLLEFAEQLSQVDLGSISAVDAPLKAESVTDEEGNVSATGRQIIDEGELGVMIGLFA